jgi:phenylalanyl-tRNA synthetase beta chain
MRVSFEWLKSLLPLNEAPAELAHRLTMAGIEVEAVHRPGAGNTGLKVAEVRSAEPVPGKNLLLCKVFDGAEHLVVCGDATIKAGEIVSYAPPGSSVNGREMGARKFGSVESAGMLCSLADMGLEDKSNGVLRLDAKAGTPLEQIVQFNDEVWELNITPNRADCLSHWGVARELGAILDREAKMPDSILPGDVSAAVGSVKIGIEEPAGCRLYTARVIRGVKIGPSPLAIRLRLERCGMRSINNVVDATNLVLLELGQPLHAFDLAKLKGNQIQVRRAVAGEKITLLDGKEHTLESDDLVIADAERPVALAGVMGGANSEVGADSVDLLLESAFFDPVMVRKSSKRHGLHTEASHRFERSVDPGAVRIALDRCAALIAETAGGVVDSGLAQVGQGVAAPEEIALRTPRVFQILGVSVPAGEMKLLLERIGCTVASTQHGFSVTPPTWRSDLTLEIDLIEEIARLFGYDRIPDVNPQTPLSAAPAAPEGKASVVREWLVDQGFQEVVTFAFTSPDWAATLRLKDSRATPIAIGNPLTVEQSVMRTLLLPTLLDSAMLNLRRGNHAVRFFDIGHVFLPSTPHAEPNHAGAVVFGPWDESIWGEKDRPADFYDLKGVLAGLLQKLGIEAEYKRSQEPFLHPGLSAEVVSNGKPIGWIGVLHPEVVRKLDVPAGLAFEINLDAISTLRHQPRIQSPSKYPGVMRDVAFLVAGDVATGDVEAALRSAAPTELEAVSLFDVYQGESLGGRKNVAFHLRFQAHDRTLVDTDIDTAVAAMVKAVELKVGGELRTH